MPAFFFTNAWMLAGLAAVGIPVIIHLLLRRKSRRLRFSSIQFFLRQDDNATRRRKIRNWLLLALRALSCSLLALAFARPWVQSGDAADSGQKQEVVIVLDRSLSMQAEGSDGGHWAKARDASRRQLAGLKPTDRAALVACGPGGLVLSEWAPSLVIQRLIEGVEPSYTAGRLDEALEHAERLLAVADPAAATTLCLISDFQKTGVQDLAAHPVSRKARVKTIKVGDLLTPNVAIADVQVHETNAFSPRVSLVSYADEESGPCVCEVVVDQRTKFRISVNVPAGASTNLDLAIPPQEPGWHDVQVRLQNHDALPWDNTRFATFFTPEPTRALIVEPRRNKRLFEEESFFVATALNPAGPGTNQSVLSRFTCEKISPETILNQLREPQQHAGLVIIPGMRQLPTGLGKVLLDYVNAGGGLLLFSGESLNPGQYNSELSGLLPCTLGAAETATDPERAWRIGGYDTNSPPFATFALPNSGDLSIPQFYRRSHATEAGTNRVLARFDDGTPFIAARRVGRGTVTFVNTSADTAWNDWPKHKSFVPWLHGTAQNLSAPASKTRPREDSHAIAGTELELEFGREAARTHFWLVEPDGTQRDCQTDAQGLLRLATFSRPGVYSLRDGDRKELRRWAVNVPSQESDLGALGAAEVESQLTRPPEKERENLASLFGSAHHQHELWRVLIMAAVVLLLAETLLGNRTSA